MRVRFTPSARAQFLAAVTYIGADNFDAAQRFRRHAEQVLRRLERFPNSGRRVPEFPVHRLQTAVLDAIVTRRG